MVSEVLVSTASISDHSPIFCTWSFKLPISGYLKATHLLNSLQVLQKLQCIDFLVGPWYNALSRSI